MNARKFTVFALVAFVLAAFGLGAYLYQERVQSSQMDKVTQHPLRLVRMHSPVMGPQAAPVTIVEFFDPACETCRAFYPVVKDLMARYPTEVRLVIRYAPFHQGSDQVVLLLEAARRQNLYVPVLEAMLAAQPQWADHGRPDIRIAFQAAEQAGLNMAKAIEDARKPEVAAVLRQDIEDLTALEVTRTPTFFVNGRSLPSFGREQLTALVAEEVAKARK
ncbi:DsbA family protein [Hydrogenophaga laconesensis]|uniref:Protein-disulfide isomerase n=1 Tax=Hydrogenophaga laconesensis TaxID=1805971 RepID=A0ABU1V5W1_9BURK|nr:thioredoxin domain-containing protein [Hydrogenophaga laconesensis]MDR7092668.1 protein-disulfide isomerase [Hydrogenophaga laconesensis]